MTRTRREERHRPLEAAVMRDHAAYWADCLHEGMATGRRPEGRVGPGSCPWGRWSGRPRVRSGWPAIQSKRGFRYEVLPMLCAKF